MPRHKMHGSAVDMNGSAVGMNGSAVGMIWAQAFEPNGVVLLAQGKALGV